MTCFRGLLEAQRDGQRGRSAGYAVLVFLGLVLLAGFAARSSTLYTRPPYNFVLVWPSSAWRLASYSETADALTLALVRGRGEGEEAGILVRAIRMPGLDEETALPLFHGMMETSYARGNRTFSRSSPISPYSVAGELGCRSEMTHVSEGHDMPGSVVSFEREGIYYNVIFDAIQEAHAASSAEFEEFLARMCFSAQVHPLIAAVPVTLLGLSMPIRELAWPARDSLAGLLVPTAVSYASDRSHYVSVRVVDEGEPKSATRHVPLELSKECSDVEESLGLGAWKDAQLRIPGLEVLCRETAGEVDGTPQYVGIACFASGSRVFVVAVVGLAREYSLESVALAVSVVLDYSVPTRE